jgi:MFS family permease
MFALNVPDIITYSLLYLLAEQQLIFFPLVFWTLGNDLLSMAQARRLFPLIATGGFIGQIVGLLITAFSTVLLLRSGLVTEDLLLLNVAVYIGAYLLVLRGLRRHNVRKRPHKQEALREMLTEGWGFVRQVPSFRYLMLALIGVNVCLTINEFHFLAVSSSEFVTTETYQRFYSLMRLGLTLAAFAVQGVVTSRLLEKIGLKNAFFGLPGSLFAGALWMLAMPGLVGVTGGFLLGKLTQQTIDESARKAFQALVPEERRGRVSMFMDSFLFAFGTIIGCLITGSILLLLPLLPALSGPALYLPISALVALLSLWLIIQMRSVYDSSLFNWRLKRRQRKSSVFDKL